MWAKTWKEAVERCDRLGISRAEMCRRAGLSENAVQKGIRRGSRMTGATKKAINELLDEEEKGGEAA